LLIPLLWLKTTQRLLDKQAKATFNANWLIVVVKEVGNRFHMNFATRLRTHPLLEGLTLAMEHKFKGR